MDLSSLVKPQLVFANLESSDRFGLLRTLADKVAATGAVTDSEALYAHLLEREEVGSTAMGGGVAIPHCKLDGIDDVVVAVGVAPGGVDLDAPDDEAVSLFFLVVSPEAVPAAHLKSLALISKWIREPGNVERLRAVRSNEEIYACLRNSAGVGG